MTITRLHAPTSSVNSDEMKITPLPASASSSMSRYISSLASMSTPWVGSSKIKTSAPLSSHLASMTFCWLPPDRWRTGGSSLATLMSSRSMTDRAYSRSRALCGGGRQPITRPVAREVGQRDVLAHREGVDVALEPAVLRQEDDARAQSVAR